MLQLRRRSYVINQRNAVMSVYRPQFLRSQESSVRGTFLVGGFVPGDDDSCEDS